MSQSGFIYAIGAEGSPYVKIGSTRGTVQQRLAFLQTGYPAPLHIVASVQVGAPLQRLEHAIHRLCETAHHYGEWFLLEMDQCRLDALVLQAQQALEREALRHRTTRKQAMRRRGAHPWRGGRETPCQGPVGDDGLFTRDG